MKKAVSRYTHASGKQSRTTSPRYSEDTNEIVDMELHCLVCNERLYLPLDRAKTVIATIERQGTAILICVCGQAQVVRRRRKLQA